MESVKTRLIVADDHPIVREGLRHILESNPELLLVGEAGDGREALRLVAELQPEVAVLDLRMPVLDGLATTREIARLHPGVKVLIVTQYPWEDWVREILSAGATGYVLKRAVGTELVRAIRSVAEGEAYLDPAVAGPIIREALDRGPVSESITDRERDILRLLAEGKSVATVAEELTLSVRTVQSHLAHVMGKAQAHNRVELIRYAVRRGLIHLE